ncbi:MAG: phosphoribosyl-ATP diphosphatase [Pseudomonadota bacterium]
MSSSGAIDLRALQDIVRARLGESPDVSYTAKLQSKGMAHIAKKLGEEATETVIAAVSQDDAALTAEASDLLYHLTVLLSVRGIDIADIEAELARRTAQSGLDEKKSRRS